MRSHNHKIALATRCLWSLQEAIAAIGGVLLTNTGGIAITATFDNTEKTQRLAALSAPLFLLSEHASSAWGRGNAGLMRLVMQEPEEGTSHTVTIKPVGLRAVLVVTHESHASPAIDANIDIAIDYLDAVLSDESPLPTIEWQL